MVYRIWVSAFSVSTGVIIVLLVARLFFDARGVRCSVEVWCTTALNVEEVLSGRTHTTIDIEEPLSGRTPMSMGLWLLW